MSKTKPMQSPLQNGETILCGKSVEACLSCPFAPCTLLKRVIEKYKNSLDKLEKSFHKGELHPKNTLNELSGEEWLYFTKSFISTAYSSEYGHELRKSHGANKPPQLMKLLIEFFTKSNGRVLDPFAGVGGTLIGAAICNPPRYCVGIEINQKWIDIYHEVISESNGKLAQCELIKGNCLDVLENFQENSFDFITTDPPYNLHLKRTMCNGKYNNFYNRRTDYDMHSDDPKDLANLPTYKDYLDAMQNVFIKCLRVLKPGKYMTLIIRNAYQDSEYVFTHADLAARAKSAGFIPKGEKVWYQAGARLRPYGYPFAYVPNICHQFILICQKPRTHQDKKDKKDKVPEVDKISSSPNNSESKKK